MQSPTSPAIRLNLNPNKCCATACCHDNRGLSDGEAGGCISQRYMTVTSPCTQGLMDSSHPQALLSRLNEQRSQGLFCDVTIVVEDVKFRAHRNILAACSGYFRSAFTSPEVWTSSQVLELMDLRSEVFASILNLLYCSKVTSSPSTEDTRCLMAAGKRLGIPFLEKLVEQDRQESGGPQIQTSTNPVKTTGHSKAQGPRKAKKETSRPEEPDSARGPRITNAFSITEVGPGNNLFTPLDLHRGERPSPDLGQTPAGCPAPCPLAVDNEPMQALSEHSYAVISQGPRDPEHRDANQEDNKKGTKPTQSQPRQLASRNSGPLKKRHRLRAALSKSTPPTPAVAHEPVHPTGSSPALIKPTVQPVGTSPPSLYPQIVHTSRANELPLAIDNGYRELDPPPLSPHTDDSISIYSCEHCPEIFTNKALLTVHTEMHKKRFVSHLFCKFCRRKFMHLKRLRNHETVCTKAQRGSPEHEPQGKEARADHYSDSMPSTNNTVTNVQLSPPEFPDPFPPTSLQKNPTSKTLQAVDRLVKPSGGQRVYNCSVCKRAYVTVSSLKRHENVHSWQRAYPCHYCNKVFALAEYRTKHEIWHTGERRYQCIFCLETFMTYYILKNHQKAFHGIHPRLSVSKKSANGGFKGSVYPIKLYRLLPMKFRKRRYKTYSQTYSEELGGSEQAPLGCSSPIPSFDDGGAMSNQDAAIFSMPVTFMATPKVVASVMPRISFDQPCDQDVDQVAGTGKQASHSEHNGPPYSYTTPLAIMQAGVESPAMDYGDGAAFQRFKNPEGNSHNLPILKINPPSSLNRLCELSAAAQRIEAMTSQLFLPGAESLMPSKTAGGETETYIAKPACPGPSVDGHVLPLCQITVKIGNEAIIRRRIKGSKLFPRKKKRSSGSQVEECWDQGRPTEGSMESSSLRFRTEVTSVIEPEPCDDLTDRDTADKLWRPYYSYKPKKKSKKLRSKHRKEKRCLRYSMTSSVVPRASKDYLDKGCRSAEESISSEGTELKQRLRNTSPKTTYTCDICASTFITASGLRAHVIGCHPTFCRTCAKQCPPGESPSASFETAEDSRDYVCKSCMENGSCFDNCPRSPSTEKRYHCSFCPQRFLYLATKKSHEKKHQETAGKGYSSNNYSTDPKHPATLDLGLNLKKHVIKTEEGEDQYSIDKESKAPAGLLGRFSTEKIEPKHEEWEDTDDYMSVAPEKEIPFRINSDGHYQKTPMSPPCTDTFSPSPSEMQYRKPSPSDMQYRKPSPSEMQYRKPKKRIEHKQQHQTSLTSKRQKQVDYIGRETPSHKDPMATPGADSHFSYGQSSSTYLKKDSVTRATTPSSPKSEKHTYSAKKRPLYKHNTYHSGGKYFK